MSWCERLAAFLEKRGRHRMIWRDEPQADGSVLASPYLERWYIIRTKWLGVYLHRFWASDEDGVHDHPWNNFSWIVKGGYWEHLPDGQRLWRATGFKTFRTAEEFHRLEIPEGGSGGTWTIFGRFKRRRKWGFWEKEGWKIAPVQKGD